MSNEVKIEPAKPGRRRRYTAAQKRALLDEAARPGGTAILLPLKSGPGIRRPSRTEWS